jgi:hypothetical protein
MNGKDGKPFKTRDGGVMRLEHLMTEIYDAVFEKVKANRDVDDENAKEIARKVSVAALKYGDLSNQSSKDYIFDIDRFISFEGNTGPYILYTIVRIKSILAKMDIINTIPLGLSLEIVPLDENGKKIEDIEIDKIEILAGEGKNLLGADNVTVAEGLTVQHFEFSIKSASGDISSLDRLAFTIEALSNSVTGSVGLKGEQGVKISNIVFEVSGDIEVDLSK